MNDIKSTDIIKLMFVTANDPYLWHAKTEKSVDQPLLDEITTALDLKTWLNKYAALYDQNNDNNDNPVYNINSEFVRSTIAALEKYNMSERQYKIYYWFDIDRSFSEVNWDVCPISGNKLIRFDDETIYVNRLISPDHALIFPDYSAATNY